MLAPAITGVTPRTASGSAVVSRDVATGPDHSARSPDAHLAPPPHDAAPPPGSQPDVDCRLFCTPWLGSPPPRPYRTSSSPRQATPGARGPVRTPDVDDMPIDEAETGSHRTQRRNAGTNGRTCPRGRPQRHTEKCDWHARGLLTQPRPQGPMHSPITLRHGQATPHFGGMTSSRLGKG